MNQQSNIPPKLAQRLLQWFLKDELLEEVLGDLDEKFDLEKETYSLSKARRNYWYQVIKYIRPFAMRGSFNHPLKNLTMIKNYLKIGFRRLKRNKVYSALNIGGLSVGLAVAMLIGLWLFHELTFDDYHANHDKLARVMQHKTRDGIKITRRPLPFPVGRELREVYGDNFETVVMSSWTWGHVLGDEDKGVLKTGAFMEPEAPQMLSLRMLAGDMNALTQQNSILLSRSSAQALFGGEDPIGKSIKIDNDWNVVIKGVYEDIPTSSSFNSLEFIAPWDLYVSNTEWVKASRNEWDNSSFTAFAQIKEGLTMEEVNERIRPAISDHIDQYEGWSDKNEVFLHAMNDWHLRNNWENGVQTGGAIQYVWLFGGIGAFVLILACINFMNLSTAQSLKRFREVGIRKAIGSVRKQLINQFLTESFLLVCVSFLVSLALVLLVLPQFGLLAGKQFTIPYQEPLLWLISLAVIVLTSLLAGLYPAFYLSGFQVVKALKGSIFHSNSSKYLRRGLVVVQFVISVALIIGTIAVRDQIQFTQSRPMGYNGDNLISVSMVSDDYRGKKEYLETQLKDARIIESMAMTSSPMTTLNSTVGGFEWEGKDPNFHPHMATNWVSAEFGSTVGWNIFEGRDFSKELVTDSSSVVINQAAVTYMGLEHPVGQEFTLWVRNSYRTFKIFGVTRNIIRESPYSQVRPMVYFLDTEETELEYYLLKLNPELPSQEAIASTTQVFEQLAPNVPFDYQFVDDRYAQKFEAEVKVGKLSGVFAGLAIMISCLGLFGLASYMAEQRTKEIGIRKVLGASIMTLWKLLSSEFILLVVLSCALAIPIAYYFISDWLANYEYRIDIPWYSFLLAIVGALVITLITVSFQSVKAALVNPIKSLRSE